MVVLRILVVLLVLVCDCFLVVGGCSFLRIVLLLGLSVISSLCLLVVVVLCLWCLGGVVISVAFPSGWF